MGLQISVGTDFKSTGAYNVRRVLKNSRILRIMARILFADVKHLKRRTHLKRHHLPNSEKLWSQFLRWWGWVPGYVWWNWIWWQINDGKVGIIIFATWQPVQTGVTSMGANVNDVARLLKHLLRNYFLRILRIRMRWGQRCGWWPWAKQPKNVEIALAPSPQCDSTVQI